MLTLDEGHEQTDGMTPVGRPSWQLCPSPPDRAAAEDCYGAIVVSVVGKGAGGVKGDLLDSCRDAASSEIWIYFEHREPIHKFRFQAFLARRFWIIH